ncbi:virulence-associated protein I [Methyloglobulus morosus KoM1]|uniref:Virulence-associated protein I n=1 Tax=Methyloglobulus morosus KoM1 TaxID=1116472 RepID=V5BDX1_9GAMM|nr:HigA family addiction module antitoxin [Methyloglobulus morosus]ESS71505.1 virulence-associated protein I [Methyloglobulus morosus KoM1]
MTTIHTQNLDHTDLNDVITGNELRPVHPGEILREEYLSPLGMSANALTIALKIPALRINDIVREKRGIAPDTALRLARYFGTSPEFWLNLQTDYDLRVTKQKAITDIEREVLPREVA